LPIFEMQLVIVVWYKIIVRICFAFLQKNWWNDLRLGMKNQLD
jgi:hypothetical protein